MAICSLGVYGTKYVRDESPALPQEVSVARGETTTVTVPKIYSAIPIGTLLDINLRSEHAFVSFVEGTNSTEIVIDSVDLAEGTYELTFESFNRLSIAQSSLKTDTITVIVKPAAWLEFSLNHRMVILTVGERKSWTLPEIDASSYDPASLTIHPDKSLEAYLTVDTETRTITFNGFEELDSQLSDKMFNIKIELESVDGEVSTFNQSVQVRPMESNEQQGSDEAAIEDKEEEPTLQESTEEKEEEEGQDAGDEEAAEGEE